jgi:hypothetical protein
LFFCFYFFPLKGRSSPSVGAVDAHFVDLGGILAEILDVTEDVTAAVLADEVAQICAETHVCDGGLVVTPFLDGEALEENEALSVDEIGAQVVQVSGESGEFKVGL